MKSPWTDVDSTVKAALTLSMTKKLKDMKMMKLLRRPKMKIKIH
jgi:hypothetical protein